MMQVDPDLNLMAARPPARNVLLLAALELLPLASVGLGLVLAWCWPFDSGSTSKLVVLTLILVGSIVSGAGWFWFGRREIVVILTGVRLLMVAGAMVSIVLAAFGEIGCERTARCLGLVEGTFIAALVLVALDLLLPLASAALLTLVALRVGRSAAAGA